MQGKGLQVPHRCHTRSAKSKEDNEEGLMLYSWLTNHLILGLAQYSPTSQIFFPQHCHVVINVAGNDVRHGPYRKRITAGRTAPVPSFRGKVAEECEARLADLTELLNMPRPGHSVRFGRADYHVLVKARQRGLHLAREPQPAKEKHSFSIVHMPPRLADAPLVRRVAVERLLF